MDKSREEFAGKSREGQIGDRFSRHDGKLGSW